MTTKPLVLDSEGWRKVHSQEDLFHEARVARGFFSTARVRDGQVLLARHHLKRIQGMYETVYGGPNPLDSQLWELGLQHISFTGCIEACRFLCWRTPKGAFRLAIEERTLPPQFIKRFSGMDVVAHPAVVRPNPGIKWVDRSLLETVQKEASVPSSLPQEILLLDERQNVLEGLYSNVFIHNDEGWATPMLCPDKGLEGVAKQSLMAHAKERGVSVAERTIHLSELQHANAIWLTNGLMGAVPVASIQSQPLSCQRPWATSWCADWCKPWLPKGLDPLS